MPFKPPAESIGDRVRRQRKRLGLDVRELAARAEISFVTLSRIENGTVPREDTLDRLAAALEAPVEWLRDGSDR